MWGLRQIRGFKITGIKMFRGNLHYEKGAKVLHITTLHLTTALVVIGEKKTLIHETQLLYEKPTLKKMCISF